MRLVWRLALRDLRRGGRGLLLLALCLFLGTAGLAGIGSLSASLLAALNTQGRTMLGGDVELTVSQRRATVEEAAAFAAAGRVSEVISMRAMASAAGRAPLLVDLRGVDAAWPLVGAFRLAPGALSTRPRGNEIAIAPAVADRLGVGVRCATVMGWAGMRGVVTLAAALTLPDAFPGRDFILLAAFGVIMVTVIVQGSTLGLLIRWTGVRRANNDEPPLSLLEAEQAMMKAQLAAVERLARDEAGTVIHPQLLRRYTARATVAETFTGTSEQRDAAIASHFDVIVGAVQAGRAELVRLHRSDRIDNDTLRSLELDLDLEEVGAISAKA